MTVSVKQTIAVALMSVAVMACGQAQETTTAPTSQPDPEPQRVQRERPIAVLPNGAEIVLELAVTADEIQSGLMFRPNLPPDRGMLFVFRQEYIPSFWMKDTLIPLDIIFLDGNATIIDVAADAQPCKVDPCPQYKPKRPAAAVLEVAAGGVARYGLAEGDLLSFENVPGYPLQ